MIMATMEELRFCRRYHGIGTWQSVLGRLRHWDCYDYVYDPDTQESFRTDTKVSKGHILNTLVQGLRGAV